MKTRILLENIRFDTNIGVTEKERENPQPLILQVAIEGDFKVACFKDNLKGTLDYTLLLKKIRQLFQDKSFFLLENVAYCISEVILEFSNVKQCRVKVSKPSVFVENAFPSFELERSKEED